MVLSGRQWLEERAGGGPFAAQQQPLLQLQLPLQPVLLSGSPSVDAHELMVRFVPSLIRAYTQAGISPSLDAHGLVSLLLVSGAVQA